MTLDFRYVDDVEVESHIYMVVDSVRPLFPLVRNESFASPEMIAWGLHQLTVFWKNCFFLCVSSVLFRARCPFSTKSAN